MSAKRENKFRAASETLRAFTAFAGETPAGPANQLTGYRLIARVFFPSLRDIVRRRQIREPELSCSKNHKTAR
jgi:hypothetical protein